MKKFFRDLWYMLTRNADGTPSSTKFWQMVANINATWIMVYLTLNGMMSGEYLLIYLGALTAARGFQNYLSNKGGLGRSSWDERGPSYSRRQNPYIESNGEEDLTERGAKKTPE